MVNSLNLPVDQYNYDSASRVALATQETALNLDEQQLAESECQVQETESSWPRLSWRRNPDTDSSQYGRLFIHEKVSPAEFVSGLLKETTARKKNWFHDFNNFPEGAHYEPYQHDGGNWQNRLIRSSSQRAMASLINDEPMAEQVDLIYMDPPYNINFRSNFQGLISDTNTGERWEDIPVDVRQVKAFRDSYTDSVHSYLDQLRIQLIHGRELLKDSGSFVVQIGPDNLHYIAILMSEVFGHENHVATIPFPTSINQAKLLSRVGNWLIWFAKDIEQVKYRQLYLPLERSEIMNHMAYNCRVELADGSHRRPTDAERRNPALLPESAVIFQDTPATSSNVSTTARSEPFTWNGRTFQCPEGGHWRVSHEGLQHLANQERLFATEKGPLRWKRYEHEVPGLPLGPIWNDIGPPTDKRYIVETPPKVLERVVLMTTDPGDLVLDPTCGSGAMPLMAERWGRRWIAIDSSAVSIAIARERIATAIHPYHLLKDSPKGHQRDHELSESIRNTEHVTDPSHKEDYRHDPSTGFVLERQLRVSAATLAYGFRPKEVIYHPDRPEQEPNKKRVSSIFTVESDMPFSTFKPGDLNHTNMNSDHTARKVTLQNIEEALNISGIHDPNGHAGSSSTYRVSDLTTVIDINDVTHTGKISQGDDPQKDAIFYICADDEVAGPFQTRNLAVAARNRRASYACIIGFGHEGDTESFESHQGTVTILRVVANRDLMIPNLQHKPDDNSFVAISEPDLVTHEEPNGEISIEVRGLTTYNPKTGQVEPTGSRNIAGILTDTEYDQESFKVHLINLPQQGEKSERRLNQIRNSFKHEIDDDKWERMRSNRTLPFPTPTKRRKSRRQGHRPHGRGAHESAALHKG